MDRCISPLAKTSDNYSMYGRNALRRPAPSDRRDSTDCSDDGKPPVGDSEDAYSRSTESSSQKNIRGQGFMSDGHYSPDDAQYQMVGRDGETEAEKRERMVRRLFGPDELGPRKHYIDEARYRWLYHWFGFERDEDVICKASHRSTNRPRSSSDMPEDVAAETMAVRKQWATVLRDKLWTHPAFHPFADTPKAGAILKAMFQEKYLEDVPENVPVQVILRLSSSVPGVLTGTWAASPVKMSQSRFYLGKGGKFWANVDGVPTPFELEEVLAYKPRL